MECLSVGSFQAAYGLPWDGPHLRDSFPPVGPLGGRPLALPLTMLCGTGGLGGGPAPQLRFGKHSTALHVRGERHGET